MKAQPSLDFTNIAPTKGALDAFASMLQKVYRNLVGVINGRISFGDGSNADNIDGVWGTVTTPGTANTDFSISHNLGRVPVGYLVVTRDIAVTIYNGSGGIGSWTTSTITLRASLASANITVFIF